MKNTLNNPAQSAVWLVFAAAIAILAVAWAFQLIGGYAPCKLCLQQRWPWYALVPLCLITGLAARRLPHLPLTRLGLVTAALLLLAGAAIGIYQAGAEWKFWPGPSACSGGGGLSGILPDLDKAQVIRCDEAQWRFLGLSFAGWNVVVSLGVAAIGLWGALSGVLRGADKKPVYGSNSVSQ